MIHTKSKQKYFFSWIPTFYSIGDVNQPSFVAMKSIADKSNPNKSRSADAIGNIDFSEFMNAPN